jgi:D-sedoheptulose 7-phosphate isomerase
MELWSDYIYALRNSLSDISVTRRNGAVEAVADGFSEWVSMTHATQDAGGCLYIIGNGGSAGMASHMAEDACKNGGLRAMAFNDPAFLTAIANDQAFDQVFSTPIERMSRPGDLLISISSSGNSPNIVRALETAVRLGLKTVTLSGFEPENQSRRLGDLNFYIPARRYGWVECDHQIVMHFWLDQYLNKHGAGAI